MNSDILKRTGKILLKVVEVYIPTLMFMMLFVCFILGIFFRYVLKDPQSWTFELSSICYLAVGVMSWGLVHSEESNIVFDMLYVKVSPKTQCIMRIVSNVCITIVAALLIMPAVEYVMSMEGLTAQTMPIPRGLIFVPFIISFISAAIRGAYHLMLDVLAFKNGNYAQNYGKEGNAE